MSENTTPAYIVEEDGYAVITLFKPATVNGQKVSVLRMREPTVGDGKAIANGRGTEADKNIAAIANLCEITPKEVEALTLRNMARVQEAFELFTV